MLWSSNTRVRRAIAAVSAAITAAGITLLGAGASAGNADDMYVKPVPRQHGTTLKALFDDELATAKAAGKPVIVVFTADWCTPCKALKSLLEDNATVQAVAKGAHFLFIDVDDWRGPAHGLIPGASPRKLPMIARVDDTGTLVKMCMGSQLGMLSDRSVATNLGHLIRGEDLEPPWYDADPAERTRLLREDSARKKARTEGVPPVTVEFMDSRPSPPPWTTQRMRLRVVLRNQQARRRFFAISAPNQPLAEKPRVHGHELITFSAHRRARYTRFDSEPVVHAFPIAGWGETVIEGWEVDAMPGDKLHIWELDRLKVDGKAAQFEKKVPYELKITNTRRQRTVAWSWDEADVELRAGARHEFELQPTED